MILYADDTVVFYSGKNIEEIRNEFLKRPLILKPIYELMVKK